MSFVVGQSVLVEGLAPCGCASGHRIEQASFRRMEGFGMAEVFTCRGSASVSLSRITAA